MISKRTAKVATLTALTLIAFAGNSLLCRAALREGAIGPVAFTSVRLLSGALILAPFARRRPRLANGRGAIALVVYAFAFSLAYVTLDAGLGALLLFGTVQVTMIGHGLRQGERMSGGRAVGLFCAVAGVVLLLLPGGSAPDPVGAFLMCLAGVAWGVYSLLGRGASEPSATTAENFLLCAPIAIALVLWPNGLTGTTPTGLGLAVVSGAVTSGLGYVLWYATLKGHTRTSAAVVQLAVPVLAAGGGVVWMGEALTERLVFAGVLTLGGVLLAVISGNRG